MSNKIQITVNNSSSSRASVVASKPSETASIIKATSTKAEYYANIASGYADDAKASAEEAQSILEETKEAVANVGEEINKYKDNAISEMESKKTSSVSEIAETETRIKTSISESGESVNASIDLNRENSLTAIVSSKNDALDEITKQTTSALNEVDTASNKAKADITDLKASSIEAIDSEANSKLAEMNETVNLAKDWAIKTDNTVDGEEYSSKYYANLSKSYSDASKASARWGRIVGKLLDQTDLKNALNSKGDSLLYEDGLLYLTCNGEKISEGIKVASTGGGGGGATFTLTTESADELFFAHGESASITYTYTSSDNESATVQYIVNNETKDTAKIAHNGEVTYDLASILDEGYNYVQIKVTDVYGLSKSLLLTVNTISLSIASNFDSSVAYTSDINFRYTPYGEVDKTIHFLIDGIEETENVSSSGRQLSKTLSFAHGVHTLKVWSEATVSGVSVKSNILSYEIMYVSGNGVLIASEYTPKTYLQGETISIPYSVYSPNSLTCDIEFYINGTLVSQLNVDRTRQVWSKAISEVGDAEIKIVAGDASRIFTVTIEKVDVNVDAVTENLELYLSANGRDNNSLDRSIWEYNGIFCNLEGFNFVNNGWINNTLKVSGGARVDIPVQIFKNDFRTNGKTIEIEFSTSNILDYDAVVVDCMNDRGFRITAQQAILKSEQSEVQVKFKEDEKVRVSFVIENRASNRLIYTYLNGIISGLAQYPEDDDFHQTVPLNISIGSDLCDVNIHTIRVYNTYLTEYDILNNFIADTADVQEKLNLFNRNNVYDSYGNIVYNKLLSQIPIMTITGDLPSAKGDKKTVSIKYEDASDPDRNFNMSGITIDVQGTSSQYYPKKNYKISKLPTAYKLRKDSIPEKVFTLKADYMESSHAYNTGLAKFVNDLYTTKTPPQLTSSKIRTTVDGFPIAMFYKKNSNSTATYFGVYNFNNDKSSNSTFGFSEGCESWEFSNNTSPRCLFQSDDFSNKDDVLTDFEARYPKDYTDTTNLEKLVKWIVSCDSTKATNDSFEPVEINGEVYSADTSEYRIAKFKYELPIYFNQDFVLTYYIVSEFFGMVDSRAKNMFLNLYNTGIWYPVFYDLDTIIGLNNEGVNNFNFNIEYHDSIGTENVYNGEKSVLWNMVERAFPNEIKDLYNSYRNSKALSYESVMQYLDDSQIAKICEAQYNADADFKYISPLLEENIATYLYTAQGSRIDHIKWWLFNRFHYLDSKYIASDYKSNYLTLRLYTPDTWKEVEPNASITVTPYIDQYVRIKYGAYDVGTRATHNNEVKIVPPDIVFNDTETILYGADKITSIGDLSPLYAGTIDVSKATKLSELKIGAGGEYKNTNLKNLALGNNTLLTKLDIRNCPSLTGALDISGCTNLKEIYATGTSLTSVKFANAGTIKKLLLPDTITNLTIRNQQSIEEFSCGQAMTTLVIENCNLDAKSIYESCKPTKVRLTGIDWTLEDFTLLDEIYGLLGIDENGYNTEHGVLAGVIRMTEAKQSVIQEYKKKFVGLEFIVGNYIAEDYIRTVGGYVITTSKGEALLYC